MEKLEKTAELLEADEYPQCPHGPWRCPYKQLWPMFKQFGEDYIGHIPTCNLCVSWAQVKALRKIAEGVMLLRYSG